METISIHTGEYAGSPELLKNAMDILCGIALRGFDGGHTGNVHLKSVKGGEFTFEGSLCVLGGSAFNDKKIVVQIEGALDAHYLNLEVTSGKGQSQVKHGLTYSTLGSRPFTPPTDSTPVDLSIEELRGCFRRNPN